MTVIAKREIEHGKFLSGLDIERVWGWDTPAGQERFKRRTELIALGAGLSPGIHALEIGCGTGMFTEAFCKTGARITAVDISADLLKKAIERNLPFPQVRFLEKNFEELNIDEPFDAVIGSSILHHLDTAYCFRKIFGLLKPGGVISFAEPNMLNPQVLIERKFRRLFSYVSPDETAFIRHKLMKILINNGFESISLIPFDWLHPSTPVPLINIISKISAFLEHTPFLREFSGSIYIKACRPL